jgi:hypothetical protein
MDSTVLQSALDLRALGTELDTLLAARWQPARAAQVVCNPVDLPVVLEEYTQLLRPGEIWRAYTDSLRVWFVIARAVNVPSKDPPSVALEVRFFDHDGTICATAVWGRHGDCDWTVYDVLDVSPETRNRSSSRVSCESNTSAGLI